MDNRGLRPIPPGLVPKIPPGVDPGVQDIPPEVMPEIQRPSIPLLPKPPAMVSRNTSQILSICKIVYCSLYHFSTHLQRFFTAPAEKTSLNLKQELYCKIQ